MKNQISILIKSIEKHMPTIIQQTLKIKHGLASLRLPLKKYGGLMMYRHKTEPWHFCSVIELSDGFVIYKHRKDGLYLTVKSYVADFYKNWEVANAKE